MLAILQWSSAPFPFLLSMVVPRRHVICCTFDDHNGRCTPGRSTALSPNHTLQEVGQGSVGELRAKLRGRNHPVEALDELRGKRSGTIHAGAVGSVSAVDATVVEAHIRRDTAVASSDRSDIKSLVLAAKQRVSTIDI